MAIALQKNSPRFLGGNGTAVSLQTHHPPQSSLISKPETTGAIAFNFNTGCSPSTCRQFQSFLNSKTGRPQLSFTVTVLNSRPTFASASQPPSTQRATL